MHQTITRFRLWSIVFLMSLILLSQTIMGQSGINLIGSFEQDMPSYWAIGAEPGGSTLTWANDEAFVLSRSLKITKDATTEVAKWTSENMCDNWTPTIGANNEIELGAHIKTEGINTNPTTDDQKWWLSYKFYNQNDGLIGETTIDIDQTAATTDWTDYLATVILPEDAYTVIVEFIGGKDATGTVWADAFKWPASWNRTLELPTGWFNWFPWTDDNVSHGYENTRVTTAEAHTGLHSLLFDLPFGRQNQDAFVGAIRVLLDNDVEPGDWLRISVWLKASNLVPDSAAKYPDSWSIGLTPLWQTAVGNNAGYDVWGPDLMFEFPAVTEFDWTEYYIDIQVPEEGPAGLEVRIHPYSTFTGTIYCDDLSVEKIEYPTLASAGSFEGDLPSYWTKGAEPGGSTLTWASDEAFVLSRSLKIVKDATTEAAKWTSENMCDNWTPTIGANNEIELGAHIKTMGVNLNPANNDEKWQISYSFYNQADGLIGVTTIDIDQTVGTADWTDYLETVILPEDAYTVIVELIGGKDATGTVWADAFKWPASWNRTLELPTGWFNWFPWTDDNVSHGYENTRVTTAEAHTGLHSLLFDLPFGRQNQDAFVGARRFTLNTTESSANLGLKDNGSVINDVEPGDWLRISVWLKASNLVPDSAAKYPDSWSIGLTPLWQTAVGNNAGYDVWGPDLMFEFPAVTEFDWTEYYIDIQVPEEGPAGLEVRIHPYSTFTGTIYCDDLSVEKIEYPTLASAGSFEGDLPSYWTKGAEPGGSTLTWASDEAFVLSRSLKIVKDATTEAAKWTSENMCDNWTPTIGANNEIELGAHIKTMGVNLNPANNDEKWQISYSFYNQADGLIGVTTIDIDQTVGTADWTDYLETVILPEDAYTVIVELIGGKDATGTVWADAFKWPASWNRTLELPTGWFNWFPWTDDNVSHGYENTRVTTAEAHTGLHSLLFDLPFGRQNQDAFVGARRFALSSAVGSPNLSAKNDVKIINAQPGDMLRISVWVKASNLVPDSAAKYPDSWSVGLTPLWQTAVGNNAGYDVWGPDLMFEFPAVTEFDWTEYYIDIQVPEEGPEGLEVRIHPYSTFTGTIYFDDLSVKVIAPVVTDVGDRLIPSTFELSQNYPNPFNPSTTISYSIPENSVVSIKIYDMLGREVKTLVNEEQSSGVHQIVWRGDNNYGSRVASGTYFYRAVLGKHTAVKKMLLLK